MWSRAEFHLRDSCLPYFRSMTHQEIRDATPDCLKAHPSRSSAIQVNTTAPLQPTNMQFTATFIVLACALLQVANGVPTPNVDEQVLERKGEPFSSSAFGAPSDYTLTVLGMKMVCLNLLDASLLEASG